ncbi:hypothetical protein STEG23_025654, partial [Scotinomys teguina]
MKLCVSTLSLLLVMAAICGPALSAPMGSDPPTSCCFSYTSWKLPRNFVTDYYETSSLCSKPAVVLDRANMKTTIVLILVALITMEMDKACALSSHGIPHLSIFIFTYLDLPSLCPSVPPSKPGPAFDFVAKLNSTALLSSRFLTREDKQVCADPSLPWVNEYKLSRNFVTDYYETSSLCSKPAVVFLTRKGRQVCTDPSLPWVNEYPKQSQHEDSHSLGSGGFDRYGEGQGLCSVFSQKFLTRKGKQVCTDPSLPWVNEY